jgi:hypothetical protein
MAKPTEAFKPGVTINPSYCYGIKAAVQLVFRVENRAAIFPLPCGIWEKGCERIQVRK